ncbi:restriction endonuclease subunit S [Parerythrobacter aestuarii]|uniref:restriction endonuclease subunit S n=1 Tax=Parerythrobacter aestuarii TaxID=3020909 RepID=UPI0024DEF741|nr:restriction endonuclease subunit S [Parerythrobacter aestuarii]
MIPEGWERSTVAEISAVPVSYGVVQTGDPVEKGVPCVRVVDIANGDLNPASMITTSQEISAAYSRTVLKEGDLMIALRGIIGQTAQVTSELEGCNLTRGIARISPKKGAATSDFLLQSLNGPEFKNLINRRANGSALQEISIATLRKAPVLLPPISEQRRIAETLKTWDRAIETVEALIANARAQKQALKQQLLPQGTTPPKKRLPGFSGDWREIRLGTAFTERVERGEDGLALLSVTQASGVIPQEDAGRRNISSVDQSKYKTVCAGDIAYNTMRMWQGASALSGLTGKVSPAYTVVTPRNGHDALFYSYLFKQPKMIHVFERHSQGLVSDTWNLKFPHFAKIRIRVPGIEEQVAIAAAIKSVDDLTVAYEGQLTALRQEKAALMQQLLTGKRRVKIPEGEVA